jgi:hypothetical protein
MNEIETATESVETAEISEEIDSDKAESFELPENYDDCEINENFDSDLSQESYDLPENYDDCEVNKNLDLDLSQESSDIPENYDDFENLQDNESEKDILKPNIEYTTGEYDYRYKTDENARICSFHTDDLQLTQREERLPHDSDTYDKGEKDDAGHLIGDRFGGSPKLDNLVSQDSHINRSEYKSMENEWAKAIEDGKKVEVAGEVNYEKDSKRPTSFDVFYAIDGEVHEKVFVNRRQ